MRCFTRTLFFSKATIVVFSFILSGCPIPIPPGYEIGSRQNLNSDVESSLIPGVATRESVLLLLGEADSAAPDGAWFAYRAQYGKGGVVFIVGGAYGGAGAIGGAKIENRILMLTFDQDGFLKKADFLSYDCWGLVAGNVDGGESCPHPGFKGTGNEEDDEKGSADN